MLKKIIAVFMLASVLASALAVVSTAETWTDSGTALRPMQMVAIKSIYAGVSGVTNGNYNDITGYGGDVSFTPNRTGMSGYTSSSIMILINSNPQTSVSSTSYYFDFILSFSSPEFDEYEINISFSVPRHYNTNQQAISGDYFDYSSAVKCYYEEFYNTNTRQNLTADSNTKCSISYKGSAYKLHVHLQVNTQSAIGTNYSYVGLTQVQVTKVNMRKDSISAEKEEAESASQDVQEQLESSQEEGQVENSLIQTVNAFGTIGNAMSTSSTTVSNWKLPAMYIPATSVTPRINLSPEKDIDFQSWIDSIPSQWMTLIKIICSCAIFVFCGKEVISILSILLNNRDSIDGLTKDLSQKKEEGN